MDEQALSKTALLINPGSGRGRGKGLALAEMLSTQNASGVDVVVLQKFSEIAQVLQRFAANNLTELFISSGDGTVQFVQTWLAESGAFKILPRLCLLPHGTTNMTAADLGFKAKSISAQAAFINNLAVKQVKSRPTVCVENPKSGGPVHGMFLGIGAIAEVTRYCQVAFNDKGVGGNFASFATLASVLAKTVFHAPNPQDKTRFDRPHPMTWRINNATVADGPQLLLLATTLEKLVLGARPFWGGATAPLRTTLLPYPVPSIARWLLPVLYGGEQRRVPTGAHSMACDAFEITCPTPFVLDGEFFSSPENAPLRVGTGPTFEYIVA